MIGGKLTKLVRLTNTINMVITTWVFIAMDSSQGVLLNN